MWYKLNNNAWPAVLLGLERLKAFASHYEWVGEVDWDKGTGEILDTIMRGDAYMVDGYLMLVNEVTPWYTREKILQEWLVIKLQQGGSVTNIPVALLEIAAKRNCRAVMSADSSPIQIVAQAYQGAGFKPLTNSFFKVVPPWDSSDKPQQK